MPRPITEIREIDSAGRISIPSTLRHEWGWEVGDKLEIVSDYATQSFTIRKYIRGCFMCGQLKMHGATFRGKYICPDCLGGMLKLYRNNG